MSKVTIFNHPLIHQSLTIIRDENTKSKDFREAISHIASLMVYEVTSSLPLKEVKTKTPLTKTSTYVLDTKVVIVPILRAGLGMVEGIQNLIPDAVVGHIGLARNEETLEPMTYYAKFPDVITEATVLLVDPMLATGGSVVEAVKILKQVGAKHIIYMGIVGVNEGINNLQTNHPDVDIYLAALDEKLNEKGYIVPGLGDCGDRVFGTFEKNK